MKNHNKGKEKGNRFERWFCQVLSLWISDGKDDDIFYRTDSSGARATIRAKQGKKTKNSLGDVCCNDPKYMWFIDNVVVELKCGYKKWNLDEFIYPTIKKGGLRETWNSFYALAKQNNKVPLFIWRPDRKDPIFITDSGIVPIRMSTQNNINGYPIIGIQLRSPKEVKACFILE